MARDRSLRLRTRVTLFFGGIALLAGTVLIGITYGFARQNLLDERRTSAREQAINNAELVAGRLDDDPEQIGFFFRDGLRTEPGGFSVLKPLKPNREGTATDLDRQLNVFPDRLITEVQGGGTGLEFAEIAGDSYLTVGVYITRHGAGYFEAFPTEATDSTLTALVTALLLGGAGTIVLATLFGYSTSRRLLRPLGRVADAAENIASGGLDTRLESESDPDLGRLANSFNDMADAVQTRIEREARFVSDVSHELRSPITALSAAVEVLDGRRDDIPDGRIQQALSVVVSQVRRFDSMVVDLLELSRLDAGATELVEETVVLTDLVRRIAVRFNAVEVPIDVDPALPREINVDKVRFERIVGNLLENAHHHGGGTLRIVVDQPRPGLAQIAIEDGGPGVAQSERERIFERYSRGSAARHRIGTGLGLALVREHAEAMGGAAWAEDAPGGGARFVVELPTRREVEA